MSRPLRSVREDVHIHASDAVVHALITSAGRWQPPAFADVELTTERMAFRLLLPGRTEQARFERGESAGLAVLEYTARDERHALRALTWVINAEAAREVHLVAELLYEPAGGVIGWALEETVHRPSRRQALRDALWRVKLLAEGRS